MSLDLIRIPNFEPALSEAAIQDAMTVAGTVNKGDGIFLHVRCTPLNFHTAVALERGLLAARGNVTLTWQISSDLKGEEWIMKDISIGKAVYSAGTGEFRKLDEVVS